MINQLSVYTKNEKGTLRKLLAYLSEAEISVWGLVSNDSAEFGTVRLILDDCDRAYDILSENGYLCRKTVVVGIELNDSVGELEKLLAAIDDMNLNINYLYVGYRRENSMPMIVISCEDVLTVSGALKSRGFIVR